MTEKQRISAKKNFIKLMLKWVLSVKLSENCSKLDLVLLDVIHAAASVLDSESKGAEEIWQTGNGDLIKVKDMETEHIQNALRFIHAGRMRNKEQSWLVFWDLVFSIELKRRNIK